MSIWTKIIISVAAVIIVAGLGMFAVDLAFFWALGGADTSSKAELVQNYQAREPQLQQLKAYFNRVVPPAYWVYIEFKEDDEIDFWVYRRTGPGEFDRTVVFQQWGFNPYAYQPPTGQSINHRDTPLETQSLAEVKQQLGWTDATFRTIKQRLDAANCISVVNGEPAQIGFARSGMGKYSYTLFAHPLPDSLWQSTRWNNGCSLEPLSRTVVLEYGGGAVGPQCFPDPKK